MPQPPPDKTEAVQDSDNGSAGLAASEMVFTGPAEVVRQAQVCDEELSQYERDLEVIKVSAVFTAV